MMTERVSQKNKWLGFLLTLVVVFSLSLMISSVSHAETAAKIKATTAKIRKEASTSSDQIGSLQKDAKIDIISQTTGADGKVWYKIWVDGNNTGYVRSDLVTITDGTTPGADTGTSTGGNTSNPGAVEQLVPISAKVIGSNNVRVRTSADTSSNNNILTTVSSGSAVTVVARVNGADGKLWYQVKFTADNKEVLGYIRYDYLELSGTAVPLTEGTTTPKPDEGNTTTPGGDSKPDQSNEPESHKRYETKLISEKWYILDYEANKQYDIDKLFAAGDENRALYEKEHAKAKSLTVWLIVVGILAVAAVGALAYLIYILRESKEAAFIASVEKNTPQRTRTTERPKTTTKVVHSVGPENSQSGKSEKEERKPVTVQNGQRPAMPQGGQRSAAPQGGQRPAMPQGGQRSAAPQGGQRPATPQGGQRSAAPQGGQRPAMPQGGQRSAAPQGGQRSAMPQGSQRPEASQAKKPAADNGRKTKNFMQDDDEFEFDFLNWDGDDE